MHLSPNLIESTASFAVTVEDVAGKRAGEFIPLWLSNSRLELTSIGALISNFNPRTSNTSASKFLRIESSNYSRNIYAQRLFRRSQEAQDPTLWTHL